MDSQIAPSLKNDDQDKQPYNDYFKQICLKKYFPKFEFTALIFLKSLYLVFS